MRIWYLITDFILIGGMSLLALNMMFLIKAKNHISKKMLVVFFAGAFFFLLYYYSYLHRLRILGALSVFFGQGMGYLLGPMIVFQIKSLVLPSTQLLQKLYLQLIPFILAWLFISIPLSLSMATSYRSFVNWYAHHDYYFNLTENIFFLIYLYQALRYLTRLRQNIYCHYSNLEKKDLSWYLHLLIGLVVIVLLDSLCTIYELYFPVFSWNIGTLIAFAFVALYTYLGYKGMFQSQILLPDYLIPASNEIEATVMTKNSDKKKKTGQLDHYTEKQIEQLKENLYHILEHKKPYLNESLSLTNLAEEMRISPKKLSELLNQYLNVSFYHLINEYRLKEVLERMFQPEYEKYSLVGLAYECGFQSKATFNRIFKQQTGLSPTAYKETFYKEKRVKIEEE